MAIADDFRVTIRLKLVAGILPKDEPIAVATGCLHRSRVCDACGVEPDHEAAIRLNDPAAEYEITMPDGRTFRFHQLCLTVWHEERGVADRRGVRRPVQAPGRQGHDARGAYPAPGDSCRALKNNDRHPRSL